VKADALYPLTPLSVPTLAPHKEGDVALMGPERLARIVFDADLTTWLHEKVS